MGRKKIIIKQDKEDPIADHVLAKCIVEISEAMQKLLSSGLNRRAIIALIHDRSKINKSDICIILNNLEALREDYCR